MDVVEPPMVVAGDGSDRRPSLKHRLEYAALVAVLALARCVSVERLAAIGAVLMRAVGPRLRQNRRALSNLAIAFPEKSESERSRIARAMWANMGRTFAETLVLDRLLADPNRIRIVDRDAWASRAEEPGPIVGCTLHMGNWELAIRPFGIFGRPPTGVYKPLDNPLIDAWLKETRGALFPGGLLAKGDREDSDGSGQRTARRLIDRARSGGTLGFVVDHFDRRGEPLPFLGRTSRFTTAPAGIARHLGARVWLGRCLRVGETSRFVYEIREVAVDRTKDKKADATALMAEIFAVFGEWIREHPEQWMWWNTRFMEGMGSEAAAGRPAREAPACSAPAV
ncbi:MAG: lipid A biosynthesis acyltransferase [Hyphomicrobiaceae bacterium]